MISQEMIIPDRPDFNECMLLMEGTSHGCLMIFTKDWFIISMAKVSEPTIK
jgi:hypothetical protein